VQFISRVFVGKIKEKEKNLGQFTSDTLFDYLDLCAQDDN
jgi:hypothetical protein